MTSRSPEVVIDTTLLSRLRSSGLVECLPWIFHKVHIPPEVLAETKAGPGRPRRWLRKLLSEQRDFFVRCEQEDAVVRAYLEADLDRGEASVLAQAYFLGAEAIIDEAEGHRRGVAMDVLVLRTGAVLLRLKEAGAIDAVAPYLDLLVASGFRLSGAARLEILGQAGELAEC